MAASPYLLSKGAGDLKRHGIAHEGIAGPCEFLGHRLQRHHHFGLGALPWIKLGDLRLVAKGKVRRFDKGPG
jgi:hypothetical protein